MNRGKILLSAMALSLSAAAFANGVAPAPVPAAPDYFSGPYLGVGIGIQHSDATMKANTIDNDNIHANANLYQTGELNPEHVGSLSASASLITPSNIDGDTGDNACNGQIFIGYGQTFHPESAGDHGLYLGAELYGRYADSDPQIKHSATHAAVVHFNQNIPQLNGLQPINLAYGVADVSDTLSLSSNDSYGLLIKGGLLIDPKTMLYVLVGAEYTDFDYKFTHKVHSNILPFDRAGYTNNYSEDDGEFAFVPGIGMERMITDNLSLRLQYTYADYGDSSKRVAKAVYGKTYLNNFRVDPGEPGGDYAIVNAGRSIYSDSKSKYDPSRGVVTFDLTYHFNNC